jgi:uncharacterized protein YqcC (DUF446 family)
VSREQYGALAASITAELHRLGWWPEGVPDDAPAVEVMGPFGQPDMAFTQWLALVLVPRLREVAGGQAEPPSGSMVATQAIRELDGVHEAADLIALLVDLDALVDGR